jgi:hypothetical protein
MNVFIGISGSGTQPSSTIGFRIGPVGRFVFTVGFKDDALVTGSIFFFTAAGFAAASFTAFAALAGAAAAGFSPTVSATFSSGFSALLAGFVPAGAAFFSGLADDFSEASAFLPLAGDSAFSAAGFVLEDIVGKGLRELVKNGRRRIWDGKNLQLSPSANPEKGRDN